MESEEKITVRCHITINSDSVDIDTTILIPNRKPIYIHKKIRRKKPTNSPNSVIFNAPISVN